MSLTGRGLASLGVLVSLGLLGCSGHESKITATANLSASLTGDLPANPLQWKVITSTIDKKNSTMSTLYGNDLAVSYARTHARHEYPAGTRLSLVTWTQQEDPRWFGAKIPNQVQSVEFVSVVVTVDGRQSFSYQKYEGTPLKNVSSQEKAAATAREAYLLSLRAAVMP